MDHTSDGTIFWGVYRGALMGSNSQEQTQPPPVKRTLNAENELPMGFLLYPSVETRVGLLSGSSFVLKR